MSVNNPPMLTCGTKVGFYCYFNLHAGPMLVYDVLEELMASQN
jgi:hypothetical protein